MRFSLTEPAKKVSKKARHEKQSGILIKRQSQITHLHASLGGMDFEALAELFLLHPWLVSGGMVILAGMATALARRLWGLRRRRASALLRAAPDQRRFDPLSTVYDPRPYRQRREAKK